MRVLPQDLTAAKKEEQFATISRYVLKYASDKALRLMLPEPRGSFDSVEEKICNKLVHFKFANGSTGKGYELTESGRFVLNMLNTKQHVALRRVMAEAHLAHMTFAQLSNALLIP